VWCGDLFFLLKSTALLLELALQLLSPSLAEKRVNLPQPLVTGE
jgi:hypothetical protein